MKEYLSVANSPLLWLSVVPLIILVAVQAGIFSKKAIDSGHLADLSRKEAKQAFKLGATAAIGPAMSVFVVMLGLMGVIGGPLAWQRLSFIGAASTELAAASAAAEGMGTTLTSENYGIMEFANATWVMALNGSAWLLVTALFTNKMAGLTKKIAGGDSRKLGGLSVAALCGAIGYMFTKELTKALKPATAAYAIAAVSGFAGMLLLQKLTKNHPKIRAYNTGFAMIIGMIGAVVFKAIAA